MENILCGNCFRELKPGETKCLHCGYDPAADRENYPLALPVGTILNGRYTVGKVLGQGGFGITYVAQEYKTGTKVAIKEFFPDSIATRVDKITVTAFSGQRKEHFEYGMECFLTEAKTLAQFIGHPNIVDVYSYFEENGTAYFAMEYIEGSSLLADLRKKGRLSWEETKQLLLPVMRALSYVHAKGIVHRDISPDNIFITSDGTVKLLDFGAARYSLGDKSQSLDVVLKHGYAPAEQYTRRGRQGPYTDVYAMAATIYHCITGHLPPDAVERLEEDLLVTPSAYGAKLPIEAEEALLKGLSVRSSERYQSMMAFVLGLEPPVNLFHHIEDEALLDEGPVPDWAIPPQPEPQPEPQPAPEPAPKEAPKPQPVKKKSKLPLIAAALVLILAIAGLGLFGAKKDPAPQLQIKTSLAAGPSHAIAICKDGSLVAAGTNRFGQCDVADWTDVVSVSAGGFQTLGLRSDGRVYGAGIDAQDRCDVSDWTDIVEIACGYQHVVGLKADGTVIAAGTGADLSAWSDIVQIAAGDAITAGLKADGTVVMEGGDRFNQATVGAWKNIVAIAACEEHVVGLKSDGSVVAEGDFENGECNVFGWRNIVAIATGDDHTVGLKADGTVVATGSQEDGRCDVSGWTDIVAIAAGRNYTLGLKADGTAVVTGNALQVGSWTNIHIPE